MSNNIHINLHEANMCGSVWFMVTQCVSITNHNSVKWIVLNTRYDVADVIDEIYEKTMYVLEHE